MIFDPAKVTIHLDFTQTQILISALRVFSHTSAVFVGHEMPDDTINSPHFDVAIDELQKTAEALHDEIVVLAVSQNEAMGEAVKADPGSVNHDELVNMIIRTNYFLAAEIGAERFGNMAERIVELVTKSTGE